MGQAQVKRCRSGGHAGVAALRAKPDPSPLRLSASSTAMSQFHRDTMQAGDRETVRRQPSETRLTNRTAWST
jgi:hypothetical protein